MREDKIKERLDNIYRIVDRIDDRTEPKKKELPEGVQHSIIWGMVILLLALIIKWIIASY